MCGADSQDPDIRTNSPFWARSLAGCPQNRCPLCSWIWQHGLDGRQGRKPYGWPAGMPTVSAAGSWNWITYSGNTGSTYACLTRPTSGQVKLSDSKLCLSPYRPVNWRRRNSIQSLKATTIQIMLASKPVKMMAVYLYPSRPLIASDVSACLGDTSRPHGGWLECQTRGL
jgi:hypothetical protein